MSAETKRRLDDALETHLRDECDGALVTGYALHASYVNTDTDAHGATGYFAEYAEGQSQHAAIGLVQMHLTYLLSTVREYDERD